MKIDNADSLIPPHLAILPAVEASLKVIVATLRAVHPQGGTSHADELADTIIHIANALQTALRCYQRAIEARRTRIPEHKP